MKQTYRFADIPVRAAFLMEKLQKECTEDDLVQALLEAYEVEEKQAREDVVKFLNIVKEAGMLAE